MSGNLPSDKTVAVGRQEALYLGMISGTSVDGIDVACVGFDPFVLYGFATFPYAAELRAQLIDLGQQQDQCSMDTFAQLDVRVGQAFADAATLFMHQYKLNAQQITALGSHGQTLKHKPTGRHPYTLQIGDPNIIAERTGITTVADFRRRDVASGGHGAPLVPAFHAHLWHDTNEARAVLNLGGIANLTLLPTHGAVRGFDTGPANCLMDAWINLNQGKVFDAGGRFAAAGKVENELLAQLLSDPWFALAAPKSTGRDQFHLHWLQTCLTGKNYSEQNIQATLCMLSARTIADALQRELPQCARLMICGGGVHNTTLIQMLADLLPTIKMESTATHGLDPDAAEACTFAWLAMRRLQNLPGNIAEVTGASGLRVLGGVYFGS